MQAFILFFESKRVSWCVEFVKTYTVKLLKVVSFLILMASRESYVLISLLSKNRRFIVRGVNFVRRMEDLLKF